jgi:Fur family transcriptional regulator, ferric uptake regulator
MALKQQLQVFRTQIRDAGLRVTGPRVAVLTTVAAAPSPLSHGEIADKLADQGIDRATIFRNLQDLAEVSLVRRSDLGDHVWRYELAAGGGAHPVDGHPHFVCSQCGTVACLSGTSITVKAPRAAPATVRKGTFEVQLRGVCDGCV